jgi:glucose/arabinose dehydrogenase
MLCLPCHTFRSALLFLVCSLIPVAALDRAPNSTLTLPAEPVRSGYTTEPAFGSLTVLDPVVITSPPGETNRLFIAEQAGRIMVLPDLSSPQPAPAVFLDWTEQVEGGIPPDESGLLGLAFHPGYATNRQFYIYYSTRTNGVFHQRLSRFNASVENPNVADPFSEAILWNQQDLAFAHNAGDLQFGPDGYLYVSLGDDSQHDDEWGNSQRIDLNFFSAIMRLDVDRRAGSLPPNPHPAVMPDAYAIPPDNPWVGATAFNGLPVDPNQVRTEFWAVGFRNPWRMSFDPATGQLWAGDVGAIGAEEINAVTRGGNYGWSYLEGRDPGPRWAEVPEGFRSVEPVIAYGHQTDEQGGFSVTGGLVYRGERLSQLEGAYIFADYIVGNIWAIRWDGTNTPPMERLTGHLGISSMGRDPRNGDVLLADQNFDTIARLTYSTNVIGTPYPETLADTGAFLNLETLETNPGIVPYEVNVPFWSDGSIKRRWFSVPDPDDQITFHADSPWSFPKGSVWIKHFELELTNGIPESRRRLETRFIVRSETGVYGLTYRWTDPPTNAVLVPEEGLEETFVIRDGNEERTQVWRYPSRGECLRCHTPAAGWVVGFTTAQLNRPVPTSEPTLVTNQLALLAGAGYFEEPPEEIPLLPVLADAADESVSLEWRVRSWLDANCAQCHRPGGVARGEWDARATTPLSLAGLLDGPLSEIEGDADNRVVAPGSLEHSMLHSRISRIGRGRMPPLATSVIDQAAVTLLSQWVTNSLASWQSYSAWQLTHFDSIEAPEAAPEADPDADGAQNRLEYLTRTDPFNPAEAWAANVRRSADRVLIQYPHLANLRFLVEHNTDLADPDGWQVLDSPANRFFISAESFLAELTELPESDARFYRIRIIPP